MADLPRYIARIPFVAVRFEREVKSYVEREGRPIDFSKGWWHPPVSPRRLFDSEAEQIDLRFQLSSIVSVTDHDDIQAGAALQLLYAACRAPISFEWTVPFGRGYFHLGVHNLPPDSAQSWYRRLNAFTLRNSQETLADLLNELNAHPAVLVVFCHPWWDLAGVGELEHARQMRLFLASHASQVHAVEMNGYRSRSENAAAEALADAVDLPVISGGDRHGRAANAILNLTGAASFAEFAAEVREGVSHVVVMPEYLRNLVTRKLAAASDILSDRWTDRVTWDRDGLERPLSFHWPDGGPFWVRSSIYAFHLIANPVVLPVIAAALDTVDGVRQL